MNMFDYIAWRGDLSFESDKFNDVDNLILSYICYTDFTGVLFDDGSKLTLKQACDKFYSIHTIEEVKENKSLIAKAPLVLLEASKSERFKNILVHSYVDILNKEKAIQFSAMIFDLNDTTSYVAFRGTDDTMIGWNEDLLLSYKTVEAQLLAANYINSHLSTTKKYYIGGHSKGGNLALFAASQCDELFKKTFIKVYNNDGPNLCDRLVTTESISSILPITKRIIPEFSVFGLIYDDYAYDTTIIKADGSLLFQHDACNWQIIGNRFETVEDISNEAKIIKQSLDDFIYETTTEEKNEFIIEFFKAMDDAKINKVSEIVEKGIPAIISILKELAEFNNMARLVLKKFTEIVKTYTSDEVDYIKTSATDYIKDKVNSVKEKVDEKVTDVKEKVNEKVTDVKGTIGDKIAETHIYIDDRIDDAHNFIDDKKQSIKNKFTKDKSKE